MAQVSIIINVYNRAAYLGTAIESVLGQTYPGFELLVWDDGSTDCSLEIARYYAERDGRVRVVAAAHKGIAPARKEAIKATHGNYFGWVDSDDWIAPTTLEETVAVLDAHERAGFVYTDCYITDEQGRVQHLGKGSRVPYSPNRLLVDFMTFQFRLVRRTVYEAVGGIDPNFERSEDYELCLRLSEAADVEHLPRPLYYYRQHGANITKDQLELIRWTHHASTLALERRGMRDRYELEMKIQAKFRVQEKIVQPPLVSIIIPCHNAEAMLEVCLKSCFEQSYANLELIVVDNNSTDQTAKILEMYAVKAPFLMRCFTCLEQGANYARNYGFMHARGDYIQWLDADDVFVEPDKIAQQVEALERHKVSDIAYGDWTWNFYRNGKLQAQFSFAAQQYEDYLQESLMDNWRPPHSYLLRRSAAERLYQIKAWNPNTRCCMDREYFTLAALEGYKFLYVPNSEVGYNGWSANQLSRSVPFQVRLESLREIFQRFQKQAQRQLDGRLGVEHWRLLKQSWSLWKPAFRLEQRELNGYALHHLHNGKTLALNRDEAIIIGALMASRGASFLEDQSRRVIYRLWQEIVLHVGQSQGFQQVFNHRQITRYLSVAIGMLGAETPEEQALVEYLVRSEKPGMDHPEIDPKLRALVKSPPLYTPLFAEQRLAVHRMLEHLQKGGWFEEQDKPVACIEEGEMTGTIS
ncbi:MAG: glycosyltransferase [Cyanobacteria bacterium J06638_22]